MNNSVVSVVISQISRSGYEQQNRNALRRRLKTEGDGAEVILGGWQFVPQVGAGDRKRPTVVRLFEEADLRLCRLRFISDTAHRRSTCTTGNLVQFTD